MPSTDFAAAQERIAARRRQREVERRAQEAVQHAANSPALSRLPFPFNRLGNAGLSVWDTIKGREGTRPAFRVGQVDSELLDSELLELLKGQVGDGLKYFGLHLQEEYSSEIILVLQAILFKLTIWDHDASYGASLQGLRYTDARNKSSARVAPKKWQKTMYGLITVFGQYGWTKWEDYLLEQSDDYSEPSPQLRLAQRVTSYLTTTHSVTALASFLVFLVNGRYRTLLDRVLRLRLAPTSHTTSREVSFEYLNRQLVWHAFTEFLLFLLPLVGIHRWRRILARSWRKIKHFVLYTLFGRQAQSFGDDEQKASGELGFLPPRTCAICYQDQNPTSGTSESDLLATSASGGVVGSAATDITNPYEASPCGCVYCYVCLAQRIDVEEGEGWTCLRCGEIAKGCKPWNGDIVEERPRTASSSNGKSVGFSGGVEASFDGELREIDPTAEVDEEVIETSGELSMLEVSDLHASSGLFESEAWARERDTSSDEDDQSEEYDEEEGEIGDDMGF